MIETKTIKIANYQGHELIHESNRTEVYRGQNVENGQPVIIKLMRNQYPSFRELVQFRNQYAISKNLEIEGIIKTYALERYENRYAQIMEDIGGISLAEYEGKSFFSILQFLALAIQLAEILHQLHNNGIIHKDIKPANILIHPETKQIKLIDFSISTLLPKETQTIQTPNVLEGTMAYLSPEQTGRMNRAVDYRSDFYSVGVTFYELLMGTLPFTSDDALELIHAHIALCAKPLSNWVVLDGDLCPPTLSQLVLKLMAKNGEDRYQSALGLKHDLEKCRKQWLETGRIESFELGERDLCDRFIIPEKLYGRETEVQALLDSFERVAEGKSKMVMVAGFSGIGKTAVVNEVHKPIIRQRGYFIKGKFDQFNRNIPFSAFVQAFRDLMSQLLSESDEELANWKAKILAAVGNNGQVLIDVIPELESLIGKQSTVPELSGSAAQNRFNLLFQKFIEVFTTKEHPLVMFLDDLQWADSVSLNLIKVLMEDRQTGYLLLLGAYRDNEVFPAHPLMLTLAELEKQEAPISTITLAPLPQHHINRLVAETLSCTPELALPLTELIYDKTQGNPFFTTQFLKGLYEDKLIVFNRNLGYWECDLVKVRDAALTDDVVEFMAGRLQKLSEQTREVLKLAACIGNQFDLETLAVVCETSAEEVAMNIWSALQEELILPISDAYKFFQGDVQENVEVASIAYRFLHDRVQQAAYSLIPEEQKQTTHLQMGRLLWQNLSPEDRDTHIFTLVNHYNTAINAIDDVAERDTVIQLNLTAGGKAKGSAAYNAALKYFQTALSLLPEAGWQTHYPLTLQLHEATVEAAYLTGEFGLMETLIEQVIEQTDKIVDRVKVHEIKIQAQMAQSQQSEAVKTGQKILAALGIKMPDSLDTEDLQEEIRAIELAMTGKTIADLACLPLMADWEQLAKINILSSLISPCYQAKPELFPWVVCKMMQLSIALGNNHQSAFMYACYGMVCILMLQDFALAKEYGELACQLDSMPQTGDNVAGTYIASINILYHSAHLRDALPLFLRTYQGGMDTGNFQYGGYALCTRSQHLYWMGVNLHGLKEEITKANQAFATLKQGNTLSWHKIFESAILKLLGEVKLSWELEELTDNEIQSQLPENDNRTLHYIYLQEFFLSYLFDRPERAVEYVERAESYLAVIACNVEEYIFRFYASLTCLANYNLVPESMRSSLLEKVQTYNVWTQTWATNAPMNAQHKYDLVMAELHRVSGERFEAMELYDRAISGAKANEYIQEEALANELAAKFYLDWHKETIAEAYLQKAYYCYAQWGAKAKTDALEQHYPQLLKPILEGNSSISFSKSSISQITSNSQTQTSKITNISSILDFSSLLKASQTLSGEIELDRLLSTLMNIILENAGASKGALLLTGEQGLTVEAIASRTGESRELTIDSLNQSIPLEDIQDLAVGLINYVRRTTKTALLDAKAAQEQFPADSYLLSFSPESLLCMPLLERRKLIGILYLENSLTADTFTSERIEILDTLCAQAAISLENARLYQQAQQALKDLQEAQLQLVQNEKMATLGNLVAGVAHEINNPVGFIGGNINAAFEHLQDLLTIVSLYQENTSPPESIIEEIEALEPEFIAEDFPKLIASMEEGCDIIRNISTSLRTFSRTDTASKIEFNLHDGIDSTLLILKYRLKANENHPAIGVIKNYGNIPLVKCYPGQLNQVFMNLLANAIDALEESNEGKVFEEIAKTPNCITITTEFSNSDNSVIVQISDNGTGMPEDIKKKIFEQGFTTKGVGKGTGLGMAIAHQIITEKHGGKISCNSKVGQVTIFTIIIPR